MLVLWALKPWQLPLLLAVGDVHVVEIFELFERGFTVGCCFVVLLLHLLDVLALVTACIPQQVLALMSSRRVEIVAILLEFLLAHLIACKCRLLTLQLFEPFKPRIYLGALLLRHELLHLYKIIFWILPWVLLVENLPYIFQLSSIQLLLHFKLLLSLMLKLPLEPQIAQQNLRDGRWRS